MGEVSISGSHQPPIIIGCGHNTLQYLNPAPCSQRCYEAFLCMTCNHNRIMFTRAAFSHLRRQKSTDVSLFGASTLLGFLGAAHTHHMSSQSSIPSKRSSIPFARPRRAFAETSSVSQSQSESETLSEPSSDAPDQRTPSVVSSSPKSAQSSPSASVESNDNDGVSNSRVGLLSSVHLKLEKYEAYRKMVTMAEDNGECL